MKKGSSIIAWKRLNYLTSGFNIPTKRPRLSHEKLKLFLKLTEYRQRLFITFTMRDDKSLRNIIDVRHLS